MTGKLVIIMRGWPGSGKTTLRKSIVNYFINCYRRTLAVTVSADDTHICPITGVYKWKAENVGLAHFQCRQNFAIAVENDTPVVIVDNTNIKRKDYDYYVDKAKSLNYEVMQAVPSNLGMWDVEECAKRNVHNVPVDTIRRMKESFEHDPRLKFFNLPEEWQENSPGTT